MKWSLCLFLFISLFISSCNQKGEVTFNGLISDKSGTFDSPGEIEFGNLTVGETFQLTKNISNLGDFEITIKEIGNLDQFSLDESSTCKKDLKLKKGEDCVLVFNVSGASLGEISETLEIEYYDGIEKNKKCSIKLAGLVVPFEAYISKSIVQDELTNSFPIEFEVNFTSQIDPTSFTTSDIIQTGTATGVIWEITNSGDNKKFFLNAISSTADGGIIPKISADSVFTSNAVGNNESIDLGSEVVVDTTRADLPFIERKNGASETTNLSSLSFRVTFNENVKNVDVSDFIFLSPTVTGSIASVIKNDNKSYDVTISINSNSRSGFVYIDLDVSSDISDFAGNAVEFTPGPSFVAPEKYKYSSIASLNLEIIGPNYVYVDTTHSFSLKVTAFKSNGDPAPDQRVQLVIPSNGGTSGSTLLWTDINGEVTWNLTSSLVPGSYQFKVNSPHSEFESNLVSYYFLSLSFITTWNTENTSPGSSNSDQITLPLISGKNYNFTVDWGDGSTSSITSWDDVDKTHTYASAGTYQVSIAFDIGDTLEAFAFEGSGDRLKLISVDNWGELKVNTMLSAFKGCANLQITAVDAPDLSLVTNMAEMFYQATNFNSEIGHWDTSNVTNFSLMFAYASNFNKDIGQWNTSSATMMIYTFLGAHAFNQNIGSWDVSSVQNFFRMFAGAISFNQDLGGWDTSSATDMSGMFLNAENYNHDLSGWDVSLVSDSTDFDSGATSWTAGKPNFPP